eukprot:46832-Eustigmatos_ZCMA.PRE.1
MTSQSRVVDYRMLRGAPHSNAGLKHRNSMTHPQADERADMVGQGPLVRIRRCSLKGSKLLHQEVPQLLWCLQRPRPIA